ncbi:peptide ABC transporter substrate-binding protein [Actinomadura sp. NBRC 104425]|uniref:peptide ABC transporter substrate-binding protein n=1 Tax=Actinomadura sp. NBRC 104425 TaxID=3032204 RepID=UPI0024A239A6|nr:ABC transporter substrate-binding protein [Actinomadura sp. NBRC 104425]GLZ15735.1 peptide ABC transporter substrate-binding protein [Actinomadura sp. NBRC 104425]
MRSLTRTAALVAGAMAMLVAPVAAMRVWHDPADPRISVGAAPPATLLPGDVRDPAGRMIAGAVWTGLTAHDGRGGTPVNAAAESITSPDRRVWTVRLRAGGRFHDGSPVTARSFVDAWRAVLREGWHGARLLTEVARVKGAGGRDDDVAGLKVRDERTFEVTLDRPLAGFPALLADPAFLPMPEAVLRSRDWASYARKPMGNGPFRVRSHDARATVLEPRDGRGRTVVVRAMPDAAAQYRAVQAGDLDVATAVPPQRHASMDTDFPRHHLMVPGRAMTYLVIPEWDERFAGPTVRHALSMAVDRRAVTEGPLGHQASPANSLVPPGIALGRREGQCRVCVHDTAAASAALADAGGLDGPVPIWYEAGAGDDAWVKAVADQWRATLRLDARPKPVPAAELRAAVADRRTDGPYVLHSAADYPAPVAALAPLPRPGGAASDLIEQAERAADPDDGVLPARLAESSLLRDTPVIPLWYGHDHLVWSERIRGVTADAFTGPVLARLRVAD